MCVPSYGPYRVGIEKRRLRRASAVSARLQDFSRHADFRIPIQECRTNNSLGRPGVRISPQRRVNAVSNRHYWKGLCFASIAVLLIVRVI